MRWGQPPAKEPGLLRHPEAPQPRSPDPAEVHRPRPEPAGCGSRVWPKPPCRDSAPHTQGRPRRGAAVPLGGRGEPDGRRRAEETARGRSRSRWDFPPRRGLGAAARGGSRRSDAERRQHLRGPHGRTV